jgi:tetratricopeptide (TPR) repeat protein
MKIAHLNKEAMAPGEHLAIARDLEKQGELEKAAKAYESIIKASALKPELYDRLMIIYRKLKEYKKELSTINRGIKEYEAVMSKRSKPAGKKIRALSNALLKMTGLVDKKGNSLYDPGPVAKWKRRKLVVAKKLGNIEQ